MKHPPVLMLGLATLVLSFPIQSSASASAKEPLTFDPSTTDQSISYKTVGDMPSSPRSIEGSNRTTPLANAKQSQPSNASSDESLKESSDYSFDRRNLPLFELPPFQSSSSDESSFASEENRSQQKQSAPDSAFDSSDNASSSQPSVAPPDNSFPFQLPNGLTDADLFESEQQLEVETDSSRLETSSQVNSQVESEASSNAGSFSSPDESSTINQPRSGNDDRERTVEKDIPSTSEVPSALPSSSSSEKTIGLSFDPPVTTKPSSSVARSLPSSVPAASASSTNNSEKPDETTGEAHSLDRLFKGDSDSIVAVAVGSAEGTRTPDGGKNPAYQGHTDPGNGVWNLGSFSYQHGASSPEEADAKQLTRLRSQAEIILNKAAAKGLDLSLEEKLNGIDLANQAPKAALDDYGGYIDWLLEARNKGLGGNDAILWARVQSFLDPHTQTWNAPGLGNTEERITSDQERRMLAIAKAISTYMQDLAMYSSSP